LFDRNCEAAPPVIEVFACPAVAVDVDGGVLKP